MALQLSPEPACLPRAATVTSCVDTGDGDRYPERHSTGTDLKLTVNGDIREVPEGVTVRALLESMELGRERVAVEINAEVVRRALHTERVLAEGDHVEIVTFVGGG